MNRRAFLGLFPATATAAVALKLGWVDLDEPDEIDVLPHREVAPPAALPLLRFDVYGQQVETMIEWWPPDNPPVTPPKDRSIVGLIAVSEEGYSHVWEAAPDYQILHADGAYITTERHGDWTTVSLWRRAA